jgi:hypothetical protein
MVAGFRKREGRRLEASGRRVFQRGFGIGVGSGEKKKGLTKKVSGRKTRKWKMRKNGTGNFTFV